MILTGKKVVIMGIRNKWSIAWGAALSAYENGAQVIFTYNSADSKDKVERLIEEIPGSKAYSCDASSDESIQECFETISKYKNIPIKGEVDYERVSLVIVNAIKQEKIKGITFDRM